jgi:hypothetical protein
MLFYAEVEKLSQGMERSWETAMMRIHGEENGSGVREFALVLFVTVNVAWFSDVASCPWLVSIRISKQSPLPFVSRS